MRLIRTTLAALTLSLAGTTAALATDVTILTPYISSIPTNEMAQSFKAEGEKQALILSAEGRRDNVDVNVTSNNFELGTQLSEALFKALGGKGNIVKFYHSAHPGVHQRELGLDETLKKYPDIKVIADHFVKVPGPVDDGRIAMENILRQYGDQIDGVWAAFDDPGIGAELATESELPESKLIIMGIDGNEQAVDMIKSCTHFKATFRQDFPGMAAVGAEELEKILGGGQADSDEIYVPAVMITPESLGVTCP